MIFTASTTFFIGGFLAIIELDLKKIVAFSTIRQIRIITFFVSLGFLYISLFHIFNHALFKTLIFCCCGIFFLFNRRDQTSSTFRLTKLLTPLHFPLFARVYMISGFQFSSSFYTKDVALECVNDIETQAVFYILILGRVITLFYCGSLFYCFFSPLQHLKKKFSGMKFFT